MDYSISEQDGVQIVSMEGKIMGGKDESDLLALRENFVKNGTVNVVINLEKLEWINSIGIGQLTAMMISLRNNQGDLRLAKVPKLVHSLLHKCRITTIMIIFESIEDAVKSFK